MPIREYSRNKPKALDSLVIDDVVYLLTFKDGKLGYMRDDTFIVVNESQLRRAKVDRAGSPTWEIKPVGRERPDSAPVEEEKALRRYKVEMTWHKEVCPVQVVKATDAECAKNKAIKAFAFTNHLPYAKTFAYFHSNPDSIKVTPL